MKWRVFVVQRNDDGSWRLLVRVAKVFKSRSGVVRARWNCLGYCDIYPTGAYSLDEEMVIFKKLMPHELFCRLPLTTKELEGGWSYRPPVEPLSYDYKMVPREQDSMLIRGEMDAPYEKAHGNESRRQYHFSLERGLVEKVIYESRRSGEPVRDRRTVELTSVSQWDVESMRRLSLEATDYFAAYKEWIRLRGDADWAHTASAAESKVQMARERLAEGREKAQTGFVKSIYDANLEEHDASLEWLLDYAGRREKLFADATDFSTSWQAPNFDGTETFRLSDRRGKIVVLDFWGTNCEYCVLMAPQIEQLAEEYREKGVVFLGMFDRHDSNDELVKRTEDERAQFLIKKCIPRADDFGSWGHCKPLRAPRARLWIPSRHGAESVWCRERRFIWGIPLI